MNYLIDYHIHTRLSNDSNADPFEVCEAAVKAGLNEIALTDHCEFGPKYPGFADHKECQKILEACRSKFGDKLTIRAGIETGDVHLFMDKVKDILNAFDYDFVIGSAHYGFGLKPAWEKEFFDVGRREAFEGYFKQVDVLAKVGDFDILGHIDLIKRDAFKHGVEYDGPKPYEHIIRSILKSIIERGKGLEINTSPLRRGLQEPCPDQEILKWYHEMGGSIITFGSDAHKPADVGADIRKMMRLAKSIGFKTFATFERRKLKLIKIF
ncbi:MAG: histidinol-phosphatase HisJ family protein [Pseudomonadota bacterium]